MTGVEQLARWSERHSRQSERQRAIESPLLMALTRRMVVDRAVGAAPSDVYVIDRAGVREQFPVRFATTQPFRKRRTMRLNRVESSYEPRSDGGRVVNLSINKGKYSATLTLTGIIATSKQPLDKYISESALVIDVNGYRAFQVRSLAVPDKTLITTSVEFRSPSGGTRKLELRSDGETIRGTCDDRELMPWPVRIRYGRLRYADGTPVPPPTVSPNVQRKVTSLLRRLEADGPAAVRQLGVAATPEDVYPVTIGCPNVGDGGGTVADASCNNCMSKCDITNASCIFGAVGSCIFTFGIGCLAIAQCEATDVLCNNFCTNSGGSCCPQDCGQGYPYCCTASDVCCGGPGNSNDFYYQGCCCKGFVCDPVQNVCCPEGDTVCNSMCCGPGLECSAEGLCCPHRPDGRFPLSCGGKCCPTDASECCGDVCCKAGQLCQPVAGTPGVCCAPGLSICEGVCCGSSNPCVGAGGTCCEGIACGKECCGSFETCCHGACCAGVCTAQGCCDPVQVCGDNCCPPGFICRRSIGVKHTMECVPGSCPPGQFPCQNFEKTMTTCCSTGQTCCIDTAQCCPPAGVKDPSDYICCGDRGCIPYWDCYG